ncbi:MAG: hypothetical protein AB1938_20570 [Myxococcota bacterium]
MRLVVVTSAVLLAACGGGTPTGFVAAPSGATCASGLVYQGNAESPLMNPGLACRSCHLGQNFDGQNPGGLGEPDKAFFFMGTAYASPREDDRCLSANVPAGAKVEILDSAGAVQATLPLNEAGNFYSSSTMAGFTLPYRARITANGKSLEMASLQMDGDCNTCHTDSGRNGAPGRITWPQ